MAVARDGCVVETEPLTELLGNFSKRWNRDRPKRSGQFASAEEDDTVSHFSALGWLVQETGLPRGTIQNIMGGRVPVTELHIADRIVMALERPELWHDGTLTIRPNPYATTAAREACCAGSTGSAALDRAITPFGG